MPELRVYEKRSCTTCRKLAAFLEERDIAFERIDFHVERLPADKIADLLRKARISPRDALRTREPLYAELELASGDPSDDEVIAMMAEHPELIQRPFAERGERAVLARPVELVVELIEPERPREVGRSGPRAAGKS